MTSQQKKKNNQYTRNGKLAHSREGGNSESTSQKAGGTRSRSPHKLSVNKCWKVRRADSRQEISRCLK
jgi:hypothetical protein